MGGGPPGFGQDFSCPALLWILRCVSCFRVRGFHPLWLAFPKPFGYHLTMAYTVLNPGGPKATGLPFFPFARRYLGNHFCFLFLPLLRCFNSRRSLCIAIYSLCSDWGLPSRVSPFGHPRIASCMHFPVAFRSFLRPSSAPGT